MAYVKIEIIQAKVHCTTHAPKVNWFFFNGSNGVIKSLVEQFSAIKYDLYQASFTDMKFLKRRTRERVLFWYTSATVKPIH